MNIENGILYTGIALVFFYLYLAWLRGRKRRLARETAVAMSKAHGAKKKELAAKLPNPDEPRYQVRSWILVVVMMAVLCLGLLVRNGNILPDYQAYWWVATVVGVVGFTFCFK